MIPWTVALQAPLSMGFSRQEYRSGLSCPPPWYLPNPGTKPKSLYVSCFGKQVLYHHCCLGSPISRTLFSAEEPSFPCRRHRFDPWCWKILHAEEQLSPRAMITETICSINACNFGVPEGDGKLRVFLLCHLGHTFLRFTSSF